MPARIPDDQIIPHFWSKVNKDGPVPAHRPEFGPCWIWTGSDNGHGYPVFTVHRKAVYAHRFAYQIEVGPIPDGAKIRHHCDNGMGGCVRPGHMTTGTQADNIQDAVERGRFLKDTCRNGHIYAEVGVFVSGPETKTPGKRECRACVAAYREKVSALSEQCQGITFSDCHRGAGKACMRKIPLGQRFCYAHREKP